MKIECGVRLWVVEIPVHLQYVQVLRRELKEN